MNRRSYDREILAAGILAFLLLIRPIWDQEPTEAAAPALPRATQTCIIQRVVDGDTVTCRDGERVRLLLIDAPEMSQAPFGR